MIVTRNPCGLKSDVQKVKAIDCPALRMYTDLIIFSVKGDTSLASKLGGGDYDGDLVSSIIFIFYNALTHYKCYRYTVAGINVL